MNCTNVNTFNKIYSGNSADPTAAVEGVQYVNGSEKVVDGTNKLSVTDIA